ncbi:MAG: YkgJ family cysteine cluster protein [Armatimonadetes bacterium]|nr:YkgJ family cysteine cluster protein [Armatimonadota bacterium]
MGSVTFVTPGGDLNFPDLRYGCLGCGKSCRVLQVTVSQPERARLENLQATLQRKALHPLRVLGERTQLGREARGGCVYLEPDAGCAIHRMHGYEDKPQPCRAFPYLWQDTPDGTFVGLSFLCTAVQAGYGTPLGEHSEILRALLEDADRPPPNLEWTPSRRLSWVEYVRLEEHLRQALEPPLEDLRQPPLEPPLEDRLWGAASSLAAAVPEARHPFPAAGWTAGLGERIHSLFLGLLCLAVAEPDILPEVFAALREGGSYRSLASGRSVDVRRVESRWQNSPGPWFEPECRRYLDHLLFRKFLVGPGTMLGKVVLLPLVVRLLRWMCWAGALAEGRSSPEWDDYSGALDGVEGRLVTHARGLEPYLDQIGREFEAGVAPA